MRDVFVIGLGMAPVGEHWELSLANLSARAMLSAMRDAGGVQPQALYVGNFLAYAVSQQANLGAKLAGNAGLKHVETLTAEAGEASGAAALRLGYLAVRSGYVDAALVVAVEKYTDMVGSGMDAVIAQSADADFESAQGLTSSGQAAMLAQRYLESYHVPREGLAGLPLLAHAHAVHNPLAMFRRAIDLDAYMRTPVTDYPLNLYDAAPPADGAAALMLVSADHLPKGSGHAPVRIAASSVAVDALSPHDRPDPLDFSAAAISARQALSQAGLGWERLHLFEVWDAFSIYGLLSIEACGLAPRGEGWRWLAEGGHSPTGGLPLLTMGGSKARGYPLGASGLYQAAEAALQLRGEAGGCQVPGAQTAIVQALGGPAATAITHILARA
jgi:acetyl-CoA C-acetyltransferase